MRLADEDTADDLQLVPGSQGMNVPSACTIVIIAGHRLLTHTHKTFQHVDRITEDNCLWLPTFSEK